MRWRTAGCDAEAGRSPTSRIDPFSNLPERNSAPPLANPVEVPTRQKATVRLRVSVAEQKGKPARGVARMRPVTSVGRKDCYVVAEAAQGVAKLESMHHAAARVGRVSEDRDAQAPPHASASAF